MKHSKLGRTMPSHTHVNCSNNPISGNLSKIQKRKQSRINLSISNWEIMKVGKWRVHKKIPVCHDNWLVVVKNTTSVMGTLKGDILARADLHLVEVQIWASSSFVLSLFQNSTESFLDCERSWVESPCWTLSLNSLKYGIKKWVWQV